MNSFSIALNNFKHNVRTYAMYIMAMIFSVVIYYNFISLKYNPQILNIKSASEYAVGTSQAVSVLLLIFLIFFIWFSNSFFINQRKKEIGVYAFMGVDNYKIAFIFAVEGFFLGIFATVVGLLIGALFGKLFIMLLAKVAVLNIKVKFFISPQGLIETGITFLIIFTVISLKGYFDIARSKLVDLFNASKKEEEIPKVNYFKGIASIVTICTAYYISSIALEIGFAKAVLTTLMWAIMGTYWLFDSFFSMIMRHVINKKSILYNGINIVSFSNIAFRIKKNYKTLAAVAILIACAITAFGTSYSIKYYYDGAEIIQTPYSFSYISNDHNTRKEVNKTIKDFNHDILFDEQVNFLNVDKVKAHCKCYSRYMVVVKFLDFKKVTRDLNVKNAEDIIEKAKVSKGDIVIIENPKPIISISNREQNKKINIGKLEYNLKNRIKTPLFGKGISKTVLIVNDEDYKELKKSFSEYKFNGVIVDNQEDSLDLAYKLHEMPSVKNTLFAYIQCHETFNCVGIIYFMGALLSFVFVIATGSIIYFKLLSEAYIDKQKYDTLKKIGMTKGEIYRAISKQVGICFILPLLIGSIHSIFAIKVLSKIMEFTLVVPIVVSIVGFSIVYLIFYILTVRKFLKVVL